MELALVYMAEGRVWQPSPALFPICTTLGSWSGLTVIQPGKSEAPPKPGDWEIDAAAMSVGVFREVWCLRCPGSDKILTYLTSPAS